MDLKNAARRSVTGFVAAAVIVGCAWVGVGVAQAKANQDAAQSALRERAQHAAVYQREVAASAEQSAKTRDAAVKAAVVKADADYAAQQAAAAAAQAASEAAAQAAAAVAQQAAQAAAAQRVAAAPPAHQQATTQTVQQSAAAPAPVAQGAARGTPLPFYPSSDPQNALGGDYADPGTYCASRSGSTVNGVPTCD